MYGSVGALMVVALVLSGVAIYNQGRLGSGLRMVSSETAPKAVMAETLQRTVAETRAGRRGVYIGQAIQNPDMVRQSEQAIEQGITKLRQSAGALRSGNLTAEEKRSLDQMETALASYEPLVREYVQMLSQQKLLEAQAVDDRINRSAADLRDSANSIIALQQRALEAARADSDALVARTQIASVILLVLLVVIGSTTLFSLRSTSNVLRANVTQLSRGARQVASAATQVSGSSQSLSQASSEQAASLEETSASVQEIHSMTRRNAENSKSAAKQAVEAEHSIHAANRALSELVGSMSAIVESSSKVSKIIKVIDEIAFQTNILALNAAVEAARAGEAGMGFAVVADEVRNLAQRSAQAAKDTTGLIEESIQTSQEGKSRVEQVTSAVTSVVTNAGQMKLLSEEVNLGSEEQARGIDQITKAIAQMERVTQQVAASAEEGASAGEQLSSQAAHVESIVRLFEKLVGGREETSALVAAAPVRRNPAFAATQTKSNKADRYLPLDAGDFKDF